MATTTHIDTKDEQLDDVTRQGLAIYERLRETLERDYMGRVVAIHVDMGDYVIAEESPDAMRAMLARHPEGEIVIRRIGPPTPGDLRKAARIVGAETASRK